MHGVWEGVKGEVGPILRRGFRLDPREGYTTAHVLRTHDPVVGCVAVKGRSLHAGRQPRGRGVDFWGRT